MSLRLPREKVVLHLTLHTAIERVFVTALQFACHLL